MKKRIYAREQNFALRMLRMFVLLPKTSEAQVLGKQLLRSVTSIGANYRDAYHALSKAEWSERGASDMHGNAVRAAESELETSE